MDSQPATHKQLPSFLQGLVLPREGKTEFGRKFRNLSEKLRVVLAQSGGCHFRDFTLIKKFTC